MRRVAAAQGWSYTYARYPTFTRGLTAPPFDEAGRRSVRHVIEGTVGGRSFRAFDYWLTVGNYSSHWGVVTTPVPASLPLVAIDRRHASGAALGELLGTSDVETESEELNRHVRIRSVDPKLASDVLAPGVVDVLLGHGAALGDVRLKGDVAVSVGHPIATSSDVVERVEALCTLVGAVPTFVWHDHPLPQGRPGTDSMG